MISSDQTLQKIRKFNSEYTTLLAEANNAGFQSMEDFYKEVKQFYAKQGVTVSDKLIKFIVDVFGVEAAKNPQIAQTTKNIFKNPQRFLTNVQQALGLDVNELAKQVEAKGNPNHDPNITKMIPQFLQLMQSIESHASGSHSTLDTISTDMYDVKQMVQSSFDRAEQSTQKVGGGSNRVFRKMLIELKRIANAKLSGKNDSPLNAKDLTGEDVSFQQGLTTLTGKVLVDSGSKTLSQDHLDALNQNGQVITQTLQEIQQMPNTVWVQVSGQVYVVKKAELLSPEVANAMADFIPNATNEIKSLLQVPKVFFQPLTGELGKRDKGDDRTRRKIAHSLGRSSYSAEKADDIASRMGFRRTEDSDEESEGEWYSPLNDGSDKVPVMIVLRWISDNYNDSGIEIEGDNLSVTGGRMASGVFTSKYFTARFSSQTRARDVSQIVSMDVKAVDIPRLIDFCQQNDISHKEQGKQVLIYNKFGN